MGTTDAGIETIDYIRQSVQENPIRNLLNTDILYQEITGKAVIDEARNSAYAETTGSRIQLKRDQFEFFSKVIQLLNNDDDAFIVGFINLAEVVYAKLQQMPNHGLMEANRGSFLPWQNLERALLPELLRIEKNQGFNKPVSPGMTGSRLTFGESVIAGHPIDDIVNADDRLHGRNPHRVQWAIICSQLDGFLKNQKKTCADYYKLSGRIGGVERVATNLTSNPSIVWNSLWEQLFDNDADQPGFATTYRISYLLESVFGDLIRLRPGFMEKSFGKFEHKNCPEVDTRQ
jgi:hypothetical protein